MNEVIAQKVASWLNGNYDESTEDRMVREQTYKDLKTLIHLLPSEQKEVLIMRNSVSGSNNCSIGAIKPGK